MGVRSPDSAWRQSLEHIVNGCIGLTFHGRNGCRLMKPCFQITIDTEGDNLWSRPSEVTTRNAEYLPRFQALCERYGLKPTYLVNREMALSASFCELGLDVLRRSAAEIGMHLHAWDSPPIVPLTKDDMRQHPYLIEYPETVMCAKVKVMTELLEDTFGVRVTSHRAGRWAFNDVYAKILLDHGYEVDCSVTPRVSWKHVKGRHDGEGGVDYTHHPDYAYWIEIDGRSLLELPMSIHSEPLPALSRGLRSLLGKSTQPTSWLRPNGRNLRRMLALLDVALDRGRDYVQFMLHSSEFMPGGSPTFDTDRKIEALYDDLEQLFAAAAGSFVGKTLAEYRREYASMPSARPR